MPTLSEAKQAAEQGNVQQARLMYQSILQDNDQSEEAWLGLADVSADKSTKRECYEKVIRINSKNTRAKQALRAMDSEIPAWVRQVRGEDAQTPRPTQPQPDDDYDDDDDDEPWADDDEEPWEDDVDELEPEGQNNRSTLLLIIGFIIVMVLLGVVVGVIMIMVL